ncbi:2,3-bisphosphoglycerate-dependent phosphoglycerate mutase [Actinomadura rubteroloni]|uniref:phosphoglycerate mutase (2,3-diphosphoglycerate-dependent) n=1 Tax=Actinomadura rubteroloni TaxID=1926885 RepID=A0A2P4UEG5_9ACTN|nr:histidine phosphatase family protein [Actinomadura rubteroloni]POM23426.1 2,3-bisphosphoglycerate-dependent phosphoglycerate mutase [Actinomadura rubteroloni]
MWDVNALEWLILARHGESTGNVAYRAAHAAGADESGIGERDADIPLSPAGRAQAARLGDRLAALPSDERPDLARVSPFLRARDTLAIALDRAGLALDTRVDERLRDRDQGVFEGLTAHGVEHRHPEEAARLRKLGKFYYRPPGGECWADLVLRLRSFYRDLSLDAPGRRVLVVAHDAVIVTSRYIAEDLTEAEVLDVERTPVENASISRWRNAGGQLRPVCYNDCDHLSGVC